MKEKQVPMMKTNAAVAGLNKVAGFDPVKLLNNALSKKPADKDEAARLNLRFKKLWFRLACPQGRIRLSALRLTDQLAIIEAKIFLHKDDPEPVANFTAERRAQDTPLYIQAAQYEAQDNVLTDAGFGIQLCDVCQTTGEEAYTAKEPAPVSVAETPPMAQDTVEPAPEVAVESPTATSAPETAEPQGTQDTSVEPEQAGDTPMETVEPVGQQPSVEAAAQDVPADTSPAPEAEADTADSGPVQGTETPAAAVHEEEAPAEAPAASPVQENGGYSPSMTVEEIAARMTVDEARSIIADVGMCRGQTLAQIADRRPASLRWYIVGCKDASNVLKAGAQLVLESLSMPKSA